MNFVLSVMTSRNNFFTYFNSDFFLNPVRFFYIPSLPDEKNNFYYGVWRFIARHVFLGIIFYWY